MKQTGVNNLSQQLCELCGIEPIFLSNCSFENEVRLGRSEGIDICKYENGECSCSECELGTTYTALFPDFEKLENFVKLFNLNHVQDTTICSMMTCRHKKIKNSNEFIKELVIFLQFYSGLEYTDRIKQAIAAEEWEY